MLVRPTFVAQSSLYNLMNWNEHVSVVDRGSSKKSLGGKVTAFDNRKSFNQAAEE